MFDVSSIHFRNGLECYYKEGGVLVSSLWQAKGAPSAGGLVRASCYDSGDATIQANIGNCGISEIAAGKGMPKVFRRARGLLWAPLTEKQCHRLYMRLGGCLGVP